MQKQIHVNSYVKRDGTEVREHFRNIDTDNYGTPPIIPEYSNYPVIDNPNYNSLKNSSSNILNPTMNIDTVPVLQGGVSVDVGLPTGGGIRDVLGSIGSVLRSVADVGLELAPIALQMYQAMNSSNKQAVEYLKPQFDTKIKELDTQVAQLKININNNVAKLMNTKSQSEYLKIYEPLQKDWQTYQHVKNIVNRIKAHANNNDFQSVANDLDNFTNSNLKQSFANQNMLNPYPYTINKELKEKANSYISEYNKIPNTTKSIYNKQIKLLSHGINNIANQTNPEARQFMNLSLDLPPITHSTSEYSMIQPMFNESINKHLKNIGTNLKVSNEMNGIIFNKSSNISKKLSNFKQLQKDIKSKYNSRSKFIDGLGIDTDKNLQYTVGHFTILNPRIENGIFKGVLFDICDFDWINFKNLNKYIINNGAYILQETSILQKYYFLIPIEFEW